MVLGESSSISCADRSRKSVEKAIPDMESRHGVVRSARAEHLIKHGRSRSKRRPRKYLKKIIQRIEKQKVAKSVRELRTNCCTPRSPDASANCSVDIDTRFIKHMNSTVCIAHPEHLRKRDGDRESSQNGRKYFNRIIRKKKDEEFPKSAEDSKVHGGAPLSPTASTDSGVDLTYDVTVVQARPMSFNSLSSSCSQLCKASGATLLVEDKKADDCLICKGNSCFRIPLGIDEPISIYIENSLSRDSAKAALFVFNNSYKYGLPCQSMCQPLQFSDLSQATRGVSGLSGSCGQVNDYHNLGSTVFSSSDGMHNREVPLKTALLAEDNIAFHDTKSIDFDITPCEPEERTIYYEWPKQHQSPPERICGANDLANLSSKSVSTGATSSCLDYMLNSMHPADTVCCHIPMFGACSICSSSEEDLSALFICDFSIRDLVTEFENNASSSSPVSFERSSCDCPLINRKHQSRKRKFSSSGSCESFTETCSLSSPKVMKKPSLSPSTGTKVYELRSRSKPPGVEDVHSTASGSDRSEPVSMHQPCDLKCQAEMHLVKIMCSENSVLCSVNDSVECAEGVHRYDREDFSSRSKTSNGANFASVGLLESDNNDRQLGSLERVNVNDITMPKEEVASSGCDSKDSISSCVSGQEKIIAAKTACPTYELGPSFWHSPEVCSNKVSYPDQNFQKSSKASVTKTNTEGRAAFGELQPAKRVVGTFKASFAQSNEAACGESLQESPLPFLGTASTSVDILENVRGSSLKNLALSCRNLSKQLLTSSNCGIVTSTCGIDTANRSDASSSVSSLAMDVKCLIHSSCETLPPFRATAQTASDCIPEPLSCLIDSSTSIGRRKAIGESEQQNALGHLRRHCSTLLHHFKKDVFTGGSVVGVSDDDIVRVVSH